LILTIFDKNDILMDIQTTKIELAKQLLETENPSLIEDIKKVFAKYLTKKDFWDELTEEQREGVIEAEKQVENGEVFSFQEMKAEYEWKER
jgi:hypothetical protein